MPESRQGPEGRLGPLAAIREWRIDRQADRIARRPWGRRARAVYGSPTTHDFLWPQLLDALQLTKDDRLLDVGCGGGAFLRHAEATYGCEIAGVDHSRDMVKLSRPFAALGEAEALPFEDGYFTAVASIQMFMFCPDPVRVLREMHRVGGRLALWTTAPEGRGTPASPEPIASVGHFHTDDELLAYAHAAGYSEARIAVRDEWAQLLAAQP